MRQQGRQEILAYEATLYPPAHEPWVVGDQDADAELLEGVLDNLLTGGDLQAAYHTANCQPCVHELSRHGWPHGTMSLAITCLLLGHVSPGCCGMFTLRLFQVVAKLATLLHDYGLVMGRKNHGHSGAAFVKVLLAQHRVPDCYIRVIATAVLFHRVEDFCLLVELVNRRINGGLTDEEIIHSLEEHKGERFVLADIHNVFQLMDAGVPVPDIAYYVFGGDVPDIGCSRVRNSFARILADATDRAVGVSLLDCIRNDQALFEGKFGSNEYNLLQHIADYVVDETWLVFGGANGERITSVLVQRSQFTTEGRQFEGLVRLAQDADQRVGHQDYDWVTDPPNSVVTSPVEFEQTRVTCVWLEFGLKPDGGCSQEQALAAKAGYLQAFSLALGGLGVEVQPPRWID